MSATNPIPVDHEVLTGAMLDLLGGIVDLAPICIWKLAQVPPQRWTSEFTRTIAQIAGLLGLANAAIILGQHAEYLSSRLETDRGYWADLAICGPCSLEKPPWELE